MMADGGSHAAGVGAASGRAACGGGGGTDLTGDGDSHAGGGGAAGGSSQSSSSSPGGSDGPPEGVAALSSRRPARLLPEVLATRSTLGRRHGRRKSTSARGMTLLNTCGWREARFLRRTWEFKMFFFFPAAQEFFTPSISSSGEDLLGGRRTWSTSSCDCPTASVGETGGARVRRAWKGPGYRRRRYFRWRLCVLGGGRRAREASPCDCSAASVGKTGGGCSGRASGGASCRRRRYSRRRLCVLGGEAAKGGAHLLLLRRRRRQDRRRAFWAGRGAGVLPPVLIWPAAAHGVGVASNVDDNL